MMIYRGPQRIIWRKFIGRKALRAEPEKVLESKSNNGIHWVIAFIIMCRVCMEFWTKSRRSKGSRNSCIVNKLTLYSLTFHAPYILWLVHTHVHWEGLISHALPWYIQLFVYMIQIHACRRFSSVSCGHSQCFKDQEFFGEKKKCCVCLWLSKFPKLIKLGSFVLSFSNLKIILVICLAKKKPAK